jgi:hypothetical protein
LEQGTAAAVSAARHMDTQAAASYHTFLNCTDADERSWVAFVAFERRSMTW